MTEVENPGNLYHGNQNQGQFQHNGDLIVGDHYHFEKKNHKDDPHGWPNAFLRKYKIGTIIVFAILLCAVVGLGVGLNLKSARSRKCIEVRNLLQLP